MKVLSQRDLQALVSEMTLEEKAGMCSGLDFWHLKGVERLGIPSIMVTDGMMNYMPLRGLLAFGGGLVSEDELSAVERGAI